MQEETDIKFKQIELENKDRVEDKEKSENKIVNEIENNIENNIEKTVMRKNDNESTINIDNYEPRKKYILLINKLIADLMDSNNIDDFSQKAKYIIEKIDEFELRYYVWFDYIYLEPIIAKFEEYNETVEYILLKSKFMINRYTSIEDKGTERAFALIYGVTSEEINTAKYIIQAYEELIKICGDGDIRVIYPILEFIRKYEPYLNMQEDLAKKLMQIVDKEIGKNNLYYIKLLGLGMSYSRDNNIEEFYTSFLNYKPEKIDIMYLEILCQANAKVYYLNKAIKNKYKNIKSEEKLSKIQKNERIIELDKLIKCLKEHSYLINSYVLNYFAK